MGLHAAHRVIYGDGVTDATPALPEPVDRPDLRVSDRERDDVIDLLAQAATDGRLTLDEYSDRADKALVSVTRADLAVLTRDLAVAHERLAASALPVPEPERVVAIFGSEHRRGRWPVPARLRVRALFGECKLELQRATLHSRVTVLEVTATFGSVEIVVPEGVDVRMTGSSIFGARECHIDREAPPGAPALEVRGRALFGEISVRHPKPAELETGRSSPRLSS